MDNFALRVVLAVFASLAIWMIVDPAQYVNWIRQVRPSLRNSLGEGNRVALSTTRFIGGCILGAAILVFVSFLFSQYR
jgi:hypothetical protein